jgi:hypothetical protein
MGRQLSLAASDRRTVATLHRAVLGIADQWSAETAAQLLGAHWNVASGSVLGVRTLQFLAARAERYWLLSPDAALARIAAAFMAAEDREALNSLSSAGQSLTLYRFSNYHRRTGWFVAPGAARARWMFSRAPLVMQTATVRPLSVFAAKKHDDGAVEVIFRLGSEPYVTEASAT